MTKINNSKTITIKYFQTFLGRFIKNTKTKFMTYKERKKQKERNKESN